MTTQVQTDEVVTQIMHCLACPNCHSKLTWCGDAMSCESCGISYPMVEEIADLRLRNNGSGIGEGDWTEHWADDTQQALVQRFFSWYRKAVFSRTVRYFLGRYFSPTGVFVEAGSGTSETSVRIDKLGGARTLVAMDIVIPVLKHCDPVMDIRVGGDIFHLPFGDDSVDGLWNVGVMEHFTDEQIGQIMGEFHRVIKPGGTIILLWPGRDSIPQKMLRLVEIFINMKKREQRFRFHPEEISQIKSMKHARSILNNNGFETLNIDYGFRSLMAFKVLVGSKH